ncbi:MAG: hypothetical protein JW891_02130 [Candidatus Lokiarchaeota archaeon]|nr:hypothetical protein [Candidatus Lokiarchaeota archaeon]
MIKQKKKITKVIIISELLTLLSIIFMLVIYFSPYAQARYLESPTEEVRVESRYFFEDTGFLGILVIICLLTSMILILNHHRDIKASIIVSLVGFVFIIITIVKINLLAVSIKEAGGYLYYVIPVEKGFVFLIIAAFFVIVRNVFSILGYVRYKEEIMEYKEQLRIEQEKQKMCIKGINIIIPIIGYIIAGLSLVAPMVRITTEDEMLDLMMYGKYTIIHPTWQTLDLNPGLYEFSLTIMYLIIIICVVGILLMIVSAALKLKKVLFFKIASLVLAIGLFFSILIYILGLGNYIVDFWSYTTLFDGFNVYISGLCAVILGTALNIVLIRDN